MRPPKNTASAPAPFAPSGAGTMRIHLELEEKIARFKNVEACVVFQSGFAANAGTVSAILGKEDFIISDELNHASIIDGAPAVDERR